MGERIIPVAPTSTAKILARATKFLDDFQPERRAVPGILDYPRLIDSVLPALSIDVYPANQNEIPGDEGRTAMSKTGSPRIEILVLTEYYDALFEGGLSAVRARSTLVHEIGHAVLHGPFLKKLRKLDPDFATGAVLHRSRGDIETFRNPEWQAWTFAGALMMPADALRLLRGHSVDEIAGVFGTSIVMVSSHIRRLSRQGFRITGQGVLAAQ